MEVSNCGKKQANINQLGNPKLVLSKVIGVRGFAVFASPRSPAESAAAGKRAWGWVEAVPFDNCMLPSFFLQVY